MDLYDKIKHLSEQKSERKRKKSDFKDPKKAALDELLQRVEHHDEIAKKKGKHQNPKRLVL